jgi:hypothetical protein
MPRLDVLSLSKTTRVGQLQDPLWGIVFSIMAASVCTVYPIPYDMVGWRPLLMLMVMLFWVLCQPVWCGMWFAFGMGMACDLMLDSPLGQHAFSFVLPWWPVFYICWSCLSCKKLPDLICHWRIGVRGCRVFLYGRSWCIF